MKAIHPAAGLHSLVSMITSGFVPVLLVLVGLCGAQEAPGLSEPVRKVRLEKLMVSGNKSIDQKRILGAVSLQEGEEYLPPVFKSRVRESIIALHKQGLFSDIAVDMEYPDSLPGVVLVFKVQELPALGVIALKGCKKIKEDDIREKMELIEGQPFSQSSLEREKHRIKAMYEDKGYLTVQVLLEQSEDPQTGRIDITYRIKEGGRIKIRTVQFSGNTNMSSRKLRGTMSTKKKSWFFGAGGEFKDDEFRGSLDSIVLFYRTKGYLDAQVISHELRHSKDKKHLDISIEVSEGRKFYMGQVKFIHNDIHSLKALQSQMLLDSGDVINSQKLDASKFQIELLYRDIGHLFVQVQEERSYQDSILNITYHIAEGGIAHINKVNIKGNTKTRDKVIRREIRIFPGDIFNQSLVMRSQREVMQLNFFDNVMPNFEPIGNDDVDLVFDISEREAGTGTFSAGAAYSQRDDFVGTIGLQIPNWLGKGQRFDLSLEFGKWKQLASFGFTEPWFMDTPTLVGGSIFWSKQHNTYYAPGDSLGISEPFGKEFFTRYGFQARLGRRLTWPDDYFFISSSYYLTQNDNGKRRDKDYLILESGLESSLSFTLTRDDKNLPMFPSDGSRYTLYYKKFGGLLGGDFDYAKQEFKTEWWFPTIQKLVLGVESEIGVVTGKNIQRLDLYQMGGIWGYNGKMRGYYDGSIGRYRIGRSFFSFITQFTYPLAENIFYLVSFMDMGNVFGNLSLNSDPPPANNALGNPIDDIDLTDLLMDCGVGFRLVIPMMGKLGFDFAWPLSDLKKDQGTGDFYKHGEPITNGKMKFNFVIEAPF